MFRKFTKMEGDKGGGECLFCWKLYSAEEEQEAYRNFEVVGAGNCVSLKKQLNQWFILRKMLTAELWWCEDRLIKGEGNFDDGGGGGGGNSDWFGVCPKCLNTVVAEAWRVHEQILRLEGKMREIKEGLKKTMVDNCARHLRNTRGRWLTPKEKIEMDVRRILLPSIELKLGMMLEERDEDEDNFFDDLWVPDEEDYRMDSGDEGQEMKGEIVVEKESEPNAGPSSSVSNKPKRKNRRRNATPRIRNNRPKKPRTWPKRTLFPCDLCSVLPFTTSKELQDHLQLHQERQQIKDNGIGGPDQLTDDTLNCPQCTYPARDPVELRVHIYRRHRTAQWSLQRRYQCHLCPRTMYNWKSILQHVRGVHSSPGDANLVAFKKKFLQCTDCDFYGTTPKSLRVHRNQNHGPEEPPAPPPVREEDCHRCTDCRVLFATEKELKNHVDSTHLRAALHVCDICGMGFPFPGKLEDHRVTHTKHLNRDWVCDVCGVDFPRKRQLDDHSKKFHSEAPGSKDAKIYKCRYCDLTSPFNPVIRKHLQTHKMEGDHRCDLCGKMYMNAQGLKRHLRINHYRGKVVPCPKCLKEFPCRDNMMVHLNKYCKLRALGTAVNDAAVKIE